MNEVASFLRRLALAPEEIASRTGLPVDRVRAILEDAPVGAADLRALAKGLRIPLRVFATGRFLSDTDSNLALLFRDVPNRDKRLEATIEYVASFVDAAIKLLPVRERHPEWLGDFHVGGTTYEEASRLANLFRSLFARERLHEPFLDLPQILIEQAGLIVSQLRNSRYEGASIIDRGYCFVFVSPRFAARMLFTLAHELGHIIAHHHQNHVATFDLSSQIGVTITRGRTRADEAFVNAFASVLLLPDRGVGIALQSIRSTLGVKSSEIGHVELLYLARIFGVSFEVAARRCEDLELLPEGGAASIAEHLRKEFGSPERCADVIGLPPRPTVSIPRVSENLLIPASTKISSGEFSAGWASERLGCSIADIYNARSADKRRESRH